MREAPLTVRQLQAAGGVERRERFTALARAEASDVGDVEDRARQLLQARRSGWDVAAVENLWTHLAMACNRLDVTRAQLEQLRETAP